MDIPPPLDFAVLGGGPASKKEDRRGGMDINEWPPKGDDTMEIWDGGYGGGWDESAFKTLDFRVVTQEDYKVLRRAYLATERTAKDSGEQDSLRVARDRRTVPDGHKDIIYGLLKAEGAHAFALGLMPEHLLLGEGKGKGLKGEFWHAMDMGRSVSPIMHFFEQGRLSESADTRRLHALIGAKILTYLADNTLKLPDSMVAMLGKRLPRAMKDELLTSPYFEKTDQTSLFTAKDVDALPAPVEQLEDAPFLEGADRIAALVESCLKTNTLTPLQDALSVLAQSSDHAVVDAALHISQAFDLLPKSFQSLRDMVNALKPGSYALALPKPASPKGIIGRFKAAILPPKAVVSPQKTASEHYKKAVDDLRGNIERFNLAENTLFGLNRSALERKQGISQFADDLRAYLDRADGQALVQESPMLHRKLQSAVTLLDNSAQTLEVSADLLGSFSERINVVGASVSHALMGANVSMVVHTAERIINDESNRMSFDGALDKMLDMARWVSANYTVNATAIGGAQGEQLLAQAQTLQDDIKSLKQTMRPVQAGDTPPAPPAA